MRGRVWARGVRPGPVRRWRVAVGRGGQGGVAGFDGGDFVGEEFELGPGGAGAAQGRDGAGEGGDAVGEALKGDGRLGLEAGYAEREEQEDGGCEGEDSVFGRHDGVSCGRFGERGGENTLHRVGSGVKGGTAVASG